MSDTLNPTSMADDSLFAEAVEWARPFVRNMVLKIPNQAPSEHAAALLPQNGSPSEILPFELSIEAYLARADSNQFAFDVLASLAAACLRAGRQMPANLDRFAANALDDPGRRPRRPRGPKPGRPGSHDRLALGLTVHRVAKRFGIQQYNNNNDKAVTAARVVMKAMALEGRHLSHDAVVKARQDLGELIS